MIDLEFLGQGQAGGCCPISEAILIQIGLHPPPLTQIASFLFSESGPAPSSSSGLLALMGSSLHLGPYYALSVIPESDLCPLRDHNSPEEGLERQTRGHSEKGESWRIWVNGGGNSMGASPGARLSPWEFYLETSFWGLSFQP